MNQPILYPAGETTFNSNGLGILPDAARCIVTEERNGMFELELDYPISGLHYADIKLRSLIVAKPNPVDSPQPFRVYRITRPMGGMVTVYAQHLSYDLAGITVSPFAANSAAAAMAAFTTYAAGDCPFSFWTDKQSSAAMTVKAPESIRALLGGQQGSVLDCYGGEYKFDRYQVRLYGSRGTDRGVTIRYGKNLTSLEQDENCAAVYTGVHPFWLSSEGDKLVTLPEKTLATPGTYGFTRIKPLDLSGEWQEAPTVAELRARAQQYMQENQIGVPKVSLEVSFVQLEQTQEYKDKALLERVELCDTVSIQFPALGVSAAAKVNQTVYDVLCGRYESVCLGDARGSIADTIIQQGQEIKKSAAETKTALQQAVDNATSLITGNSGGYVVLHSSTGQKQPDEILIMDKPKIADAVKIWRWNKQGLGYSSHGYNGPYGLAMTADGAIVADFITTGSLNAALVKIGKATLTSVLNGMETRVASAEGKATTVQQTLDGLTLSAVNSKDNTSSTLKLTSGGTELTSADINLNGLVSFNNLSSTDPNNKTTINGSLITAGKIQSANGQVYFDLNGNELAASVLKDAISRETQAYIGEQKILSAFGDYETSNGLNISYKHYLWDDEDTENVFIGVANDFNAIQSSNRFYLTATSYDGVSRVYRNSIFMNFGIQFIAEDYWVADMYGDQISFRVPLYVKGTSVTSDRAAKTNITNYTSSVLQKIMDSEVYRYQFKRDSALQSCSADMQKKTNTNALHLGLMYDEAPEEIRSESDKNKGIDLYAMCSMLWKGVQELTQRIERLEETANGED